MKTDVYSYGRLISHLFFGPNSFKYEDNKDGDIKLPFNNKLYDQLIDLIITCVKFAPD